MLDRIRPWSTPPDRWCTTATYGTRSRPIHSAAGAAAMLSSRMPADRSDAARTVRAAVRVPRGHASAGIEKDQKALQTRLAALTSTSALAPFAGRPGVLRSAWPRLGMDQQRTIIGLALGRIAVFPALRPGHTRFDPERVRIAPRS